MFALFILALSHTPCSRGNVPLSECNVSLQHCLRETNVFFILRATHCAQWIIKTWNNYISLCVRPMGNCVVIERRLCTGRIRLAIARSSRLSRIWRGGGETVGRSITGHHLSRACQWLQISKPFYHREKIACFDHREELGKLSNFIGYNVRSH
jgi:hypothetical protein